MPKCIWCLETDPNVVFDNEAHIFPQSLDGKNICPDVCHSCNSYFGNKDGVNHPIDLVLKETFNITRHKLILPLEKVHSWGLIPKIGKYKRFTSQFFRVDFQTNRIEAKPSFMGYPNFKDNLTRQLKKGIYKIVLEEFHRQKGAGHNQNFDFIRDFSRHDRNNLPLYYFKPKHGMILTDSDSILNPCLEIGARQEEILERYGFFEFDIFHHKFAIPLNQSQSKLDDYLLSFDKENSIIFEKGIEVKQLFDIDLTLSIFNS